MCFHPRVEALVAHAAAPARARLYTRLVDGPPQVFMSANGRRALKRPRMSLFRHEAPVDFSTSRTMARRAGHLRSLFLRFNPHHTHAHTHRRVRGRSGGMRLGPGLQACSCGWNRRKSVCPRAPAWRHRPPLTLFHSLRDVSVQLPAKGVGVSCPFGCLSLPNVSEMWRRTPRTQALSSTQGSLAPQTGWNFRTAPSVCQKWFMSKEQRCPARLAAQPPAVTLKWAESRLFHQIEHLEARSANCA